MTSKKNRAAPGAKTEPAQKTTSTKPQSTRARCKRQHAGLAMLDQLFGRREGGPR